jgi:AraC-like DNA-binding protein
MRITVRRTDGDLHRRRYWPACAARLLDDIVEGDASLPDSERQSSDPARQDRSSEMSANQAMEKIGTVPTAAGGIARAAYARAALSLPDVALVAKRAGITLKQLKEPGFRIPVGSQIIFLNLVAARLEDEFLGYHLATEIDLRDLGLLYYVLASSDTLGEAMKRGQRYCSLQNEGVLMKYRDDGRVCVSFHYNGVRRLSDRHQIEFFVTTLVRLCRQLVGWRLNPIRIRLAHRRTELSTGVAVYFGCEFDFGSEVDEIEYAPLSGRLPVASADTYLNKLLMKYCEEALSRRRLKVQSWRLAVENTLAPLLPHGQGRLSEVAARLGVSIRTLERRLARENISFVEVLDELRFELAKRYLQEPNLPISEIAWLLGYADPSAFTHSFRRWTGKSPTQLRVA